MLGLHHQFTAADLSDQAKLPTMHQDSFDFLWDQLGQPDEDYSQLFDIDSEVLSDGSSSPASLNDSGIESEVNII